MLIESLKVFCDLADLKSFSKAAEANYVTQPAVSQQVKNLEKNWKVRLLDRDKRNIDLTRPGEILYKKAKAILEQYERKHKDEPQNFAVELSLLSMREHIKDSQEQIRLNQKACFNSDR